MYGAFQPFDKATAFKVGDTAYSLEGWQWQRNGICGEPFVAVSFSEMWRGRRARRTFVAILFSNPDENGDESPTFTGHCAVLCLTDPDTAWRGDQFEAALRPIMATVINEDTRAAIGPWVPEAVR